MVKLARQQHDVRSLLKKPGGATLVDRHANRLKDRLCPEKALQRGSRGDFDVAQNAVTVVGVSSDVDLSTYGVAIFFFVKQPHTSPLLSFPEKTGSTAKETILFGESLRLGEAGGGSLGLRKKKECDRPTAKPFEGRPRLQYVGKNNTEDNDTRHHQQQQQ